MAKYRRDMTCYTSNTRQQGKQISFLAAILTKYAMAKFIIRGITHNKLSINKQVKSEQQLSDYINPFTQLVKPF